MGDSVDMYLGQWRAERPDLDHTPMGVVGRISRAARFLERGMQDNFAAHGLRGYEFDILATLRRAGHPYQLTAGDLVGTSMKTSGAITNRIDRLAAKGLVSRETDPTNRRSVLITLTEHGHQVVDDTVADHLDRERQLLAALRPEEQEQLAGLLRTLLLGLGDTAPERPAPPSP
ncbi:DNA-binding MarR family transcriptional regulator [Haloactinopolyspora alba]|uniref:DNA-binding MarR family transcriptional regulator n=1 Tax=Haloactinopolyspora alba TaxID=648780 RepID=A0A2P8DWI2_9ACTN|nr:MarR family transcriptional regulator [Haloactinopolyspora alba]PSL01589.1 DNA-binding MarR family transcriptional regulator [Haloactinopolyspora alba]